MTIQEFIIRALIVVLIGLLIGVERKVTGHNIDLKTTVLIAIGTFAFVSLEVILNKNDPRMAANIITGIGFLCSGVIFKNGLTVNGLNTSATLWSTAGISVLISYGFIYYGLIATGVLVIFNLILPFISKIVKPIPFLVDNTTEESYNINIVCLKDQIKDIKNYFITEMNEKISLDALQINNITDDKYRITARIICNKKEYLSSVSELLLEKNDILSISWDKIEDCQKV